MLAKTGLLIVSNPTQIGKILPSIKKQVQKTLYIQLLSALTEPFGCFHSTKLNTWPKYSQTIYGIYSQAVTHCYDLDVRVLLSGIKYRNLKQIYTNSNVDLVIFDQCYNQKEIESFVQTKIANIALGCDILTLDTGNFVPFDCKDDGSVYQHVVLGGTFDRLHVAHKLLLSEAALRSNQCVTIGITDENMIKSKVLWELIENISVRIDNVRNFLTDICRELTYNIVPINDPFGPAITEPSMEMIIVSQETIKGGEKINELREKNNLKPLKMHTVKLIDEPNPGPFEETKISSSNNRIRTLGTLIKKTENTNIPKNPYVIGLTGGIASGKSFVSKLLNQHGVTLINCDELGHQVYKKGKPCYDSLIKHFGNSIIGSDNEIDRKVLGPIVFGHPEQMNKLNSLVWPAIASEVAEIINETKDGIVVVEAAILISAGWNRLCHEVWVTVANKEVAIERLKQRNGLSIEQAESRISSQPPSNVYVQQANVVISTIWSEEQTKLQVDKAWKLLTKRIL